MIYNIWGEESQIKIKIWLRYKVSGGCVMLVVSCFFRAFSLPMAYVAIKVILKKKFNVFHSEVELNLE